jgi:hypothetical protein
MPSRISNSLTNNEICKSWLTILCFLCLLNVDNALWKLNHLLPGQKSNGDFLGTPDYSRTRLDSVPQEQNASGQTEQQERSSAAEAGRCDGHLVEVGLTGQFIANGVHTPEAATDTESRLYAHDRPCGWTPAVELDSLSSMDDHASAEKIDETWRLLPLYNSNLQIEYSSLA